MPYLAKMTITATNVNGDTFVHEEGTVLSDWELSDTIRARVAEGSEWYRDRFEVLLDREAHHYRVEATKAAGIREVEGQDINPPFDDYVGLHPAEIIDRMKTVEIDKARQIRLYEQGGMNRQQIVSYVSPAEKEPFVNYDSMGVLEICEKLSVLSDAAVADTKIYEANHRSRDMILGYERELYGDSQASVDPTQGLIPEPSPSQPTVPTSPAPPVATEGSLPSTDQQLAARQSAVPPGPPAPVQPVAAPPAG